MATKHLRVEIINGNHAFVNLKGGYIDGEYVYSPLVEYEWYDT